MRVLFGVRPDLQSDYGGDTTQILQTRDHLLRMGLEVVLDDRLDLDPAGFDLVHLFHLTRIHETYLQWRSVRSRAPKTPVVLSTIYWPTDEYDRLGRFGVERGLVRLLGTGGWEYGKTAGKWLLTRCRRQRRALATTLHTGFQAQQRELVIGVDALLPNSHAEASVLVERFGVSVERTHVVYNGCDVVRTTESNHESTLDSRSGILCVGRIEPRKNPLRVIRALRDSPYTLTVAGNAGVYHRRYLQACRRAASDRVTFLPRQSPKALGHLYRQATLHVCASWYETPGLVNLEAALHGCRLVVPDRGSVREYLGDGAQYCQPSDVASIRRAVEGALEAPHDGAALAERLSRFTWENAARATLAAYRRVVS